MVLMGLAHCLLVALDASVQKSAAETALQQLDTPPLDQDCEQTEMQTAFAWDCTPGPEALSALQGCHACKLGSAPTMMAHGLAPAPESPGPGESCLGPQTPGWVHWGATPEEGVGCQRLDHPQVAQTARVEAVMAGMGLLWWGQPAGACGYAHAGPSLGQRMAEPHAAHLSSDADCMRINDEERHLALPAVTDAVRLDPGEPTLRVLLWFG